MTGTNPDLPVVLPSLTAEPEPVPREVWTADPGVWVSLRERAGCGVFLAAVFGAAWWLTGSALGGLLVLAAFCVCAGCVLALPAFLSCRRRLVELDRRTAVLSQQSAVDRGDVLRVVAEARNERLDDEVARKRAERRHPAFVPGQRASETKETP